ncbi:unnamed protein product [Ixodes persulcatus]
MESTRDDISFFTRGLYTDVEFLVGNYSHLPRRIRAHKLLLAMRNEVFEVMFYGDLPEVNEIRIPDLHPDGFVGLLSLENVAQNILRRVYTLLLLMYSFALSHCRYLYSQRATFDSLEQAMQTRVAAQKYLETKLENACDEFIRKSLQPSNVCKVLDYVIKEGDLGMLDDIIDEFLAHEAMGVLASEAFIAASRETIFRILRSPRLVAPELYVIERVSTWALAQCRRGPAKIPPTALQKTMRPFLSELRFLTLTVEQFVAGPGTWNILTETDALAIVSNIVEPGSKPLPAGICTKIKPREGY